MTRSRFLRWGFCLLLAFCFFNPPALTAPQLAPSALLEVDTGQEGQIGGVVRVAGAGPNINDFGAFFQGLLIQPLSLSKLTESSIEPLFDEGEFPNGPKRVTLRWSEVTLKAGTTFIPGFVGAFLPARIGAALTPEQFLASILRDYILEVNGFQFMDSDLLKPENITSVGPIDNRILPTLPPGDFYSFGLNITMKINTPGVYIIRNIMRIPKTMPVPELGATYLAGQLIYEIPIRIIP